MTGKIVTWLKSESNRAIIKMIAAGFSAVCAGIWAVYMFMAEPHTASVDKNTSLSVTATSGSVAAGRDANGITINND